MLRIFKPRKKVKGFRFWRGFAIVNDGIEYKVVHFEIELDEPQLDNRIVEIDLKRTDNFTVNGYKPISLTVPPKSFWALSYTAEIK